MYQKKSKLGYIHEGLSSLYLQRDLFFMMAKRDLRSRYRNTSLGWIWSLIRPLIALSVYMIVVGQFLGASQGTKSYGLFVFSGFLAYTLFVNFSVGAMKSVVDNAELVKKINFPRLFLPLSAGVVACTDAILNFAVLILGFLIYGSWPSITQLALLPLAYLIVLLFGLAVGIWGAVINVKYRDFGYLFETIVNLGIWLTPMMYSYAFVLKSLESNQVLLKLYLLNPMSNVVIQFQRSLWPPASDAITAENLFPGRLGLRLGLLLLGAALAFLSAIAFYIPRSRKFSEKL
jgi:ABC-2 type transport system permease protein